MLACEQIMTAAEMEADRERWLSMRLVSIGGSDAAAIVGMNPWKSTYALWLEKTGKASEEDRAGLEHVRFGNVLEEVVAREFCQREGKRVRRCGMYRSREYPFLTASFDRLLTGEEAGLEIKTSSAYNRGSWDDGEIPAHYRLQCVHYMLVSGLPRWYIACLVGGNHYVCWEIERNEDDVNALLDAERTFWDSVQRGAMPVLDGSESCTEALRKRYRGGNMEPVRLPAESVGLLRRWDELRALRREAEREAAEIQNKLCAMMGDNEIGLIGDGEDARRVSWKSIPGRVTVDGKRLKSEMPDVYEKYSKRSDGHRRFTA